MGDVFSYLQSKFVLDIDEVELIKGELTSRERAEKLIETVLIPWAEQLLIAFQLGQLYFEKGLWL